MNCADTGIPEIARNLAFNEAEIIINSLRQGPFIGGLRHRVPVSQVRAMENQCYVLVVNQAGPEGAGHSVTCDPEGRVLEELGETESFAVVSLNLEEVRRVRAHGSFGIGVKFHGAHPGLPTGRWRAGRVLSPRARERARLSKRRAPRVSYALSAEPCMGASRQYALEGGCFVLAPVAITSREWVERMADTPERADLIETGGGGSCIFAPDGSTIAVPRRGTRRPSSMPTWTSTTSPGPRTSIWARSRRTGWPPFSRPNRPLKSQALDRQASAGEVLEQHLRLLQSDRSPALHHVVDESLCLRLVGGVEVQ
jgi:hypothetical protein